MACQHCSGLLDVGELQPAYDAYEKADFHTALKLSLPFAEAGNVIAQCLLGGLFQLGLGTIYDYPTAIRWYSLAAEQGCPLAWNNLATIYSVSGDRDRARECYHKAVKLGFDLAPPDYYD